MEDWKPHRRADLVVRRSGSCTLLVERQSHRTHVLNETAEFIWKRCDGRNTPRDLEEKLRLAFDIPSGVDLEKDVERALALLRSKGLLDETDH